MKMVCPNINSEAWKNLVAKIGTFDAMKEFIRNNGEIPNAEGYQESFKGVNATMKIVTALQKLKRTSYPSNSIQGFYNDLIKQGAPKNQIILLQEHISNNNITNINVPDLIVSLLSEMSYIVEINTAKTKSPYDFTEEGYNEHSRTFEYNGYEYEFDDYNLEETGGIGDFFKAPLNNLNNKERITKAEFNTAASNIGKNKAAKETPTQYYSSMTVPGGTNYTENEISTPLITPSIKGHAQFSTDNGIGWTRTDEKVDYIEEGSDAIEFLIDKLQESGQLKIDC